MDPEIEVAVILCKAVGGLRFEQQIAAVLQIANLIYAGISLGKLAVQCVNVRIIGLVAVYIQIEHKFCAAEQLIVILAADLPDLHLAGQEFVDDRDLDGLVHLGYRYLVSFL